MATTVVKSGNVYQIAGMDADQALPKMKVGMICCTPSASTDIIIVKEGSATGPIIFGCYGGGAVDLGGVEVTPFFDVSACTLGTAANAAISATRVG